jgi:hypothetical protein
MKRKFFFSPYSKNVGAEFVSKIDLASSTTPTHGHVHSMMIHTYTTLHHTYVRHSTVPDIAPLQCIRYVPPSVGLHQMHTIVVPSLEYLRSITCIAKQTQPLSRSI